MADDLVEASAPGDSAPEAPAGRVSAFGRTLSSVVDVGRELLARRRAAGGGQRAANPAQALALQCQELIEHRGEASGLALASDIASAYQQLAVAQRPDFFQRLARDFAPDYDEVLAALEAYRAAPSPPQLQRVSRAVEAPRLKLFRRINTAPEGIRTLVAMRGHLLGYLAEYPELKPVDVDLRHLFIAWFNKGFLELRQIDWSSPAAVLEKIIAYEAVHEINGWEELRSRLADDRRCFAFFHPALSDDPLVFVEIALTQEIPDALPPLLQQHRPRQRGGANTVVFYSISNCHDGLHGISFGNFLIKSVVQELKKELPELDTFVTLSPVPGFRRWLLGADLEGLVEPELVPRVREPLGKVVDAEVYDALLALCAHYLLRERSGDFPRDPVARFHLGNGAQMYRLNGAADMSPKGREQSAGIMVNYLYDLSKIEENNDAYFERGKIAASKAMTRLLSQ